MVRTGHGKLSLFLRMLRRALFLSGSLMSSRLLDNDKSLYTALDMRVTGVP